MITGVRIHGNAGAGGRRRRTVSTRGLAIVAGMVGALSVGLAPDASLAQSARAQGPPQFLTVPIRSRMVPAGLENGHEVYVPPVAADHVGGPAMKPGGGNGGQHGGHGGNGATDFGQPGGVNVTSTCFPDSGTNYDATCAQDSYQGEPMAIGAGTLLIGSENDIYPGACSASALPGTFGDCGLSVTASGDGVSWTRTKLSRNWGGQDFLIGFDPSVTAASGGRVFSCFGVADGGASGPNGVVVTSSTDGGQTWVKANPVVLDLSGHYFEDKPWIAADANANRLYVAWDRNSGNDQLLLVSTSSDQGKTWTSPVKINDGRSKFERVIDAFPAVAPDGTVYVLWDDYARNELFIDKSSDGGATWGKDVAVAPTHIGFGTDIGCNGTRSMGPSPQMAIAADGSSIDVVYADDTSGSGDYDVFLTRSTDGGKRWSTPRRVSATSVGQQYNPAIAIDAAGTVHVTYLDRRVDTENDCRTNTYMSNWANGGTSLSWVEDVLITDWDSDFDGNPNGPGDYGSVTALGSTTYPYFADHRDANATVDGTTATLDGGFEIYAAHRP